MDRPKTRANLGQTVCLLAAAVFLAYAPMQRARAQAAATPPPAQPTDSPAPAPAENAGATAPAQVVLKLIDFARVNPHWLLTGQGDPHDYRNQHRASGRPRF